MDKRSFVHLHNHTEYSLLDGAQPIPKLVRRAKDFEMPAVTMTDHGNLFGAIKFYQQARKEQIKPIIGCEAYLAPGSCHDRTPNQGPHGKPYYHLILLAENKVGFHNLIELASHAYLDGFYYRPRVDKALLRRYSEGLICLTACLAGEVATYLRKDDPKGALKAAEEYADIFGPDNVFLEMQDQGIPIEEKVNEGVVEIARKTGLPLVCTNDAHFLCREDHGAHDVLVRIGTGKTRDDQTNMAYEEDHYFKAPEEMWERFEWCPEALLNTLEIAERCDLELDFSQHHVPAFPVDEGETIESAFVKQTKAGLEERKKTLRRRKAEGRLRHDFEEYDKRLEAEIDVIRQMGFPGYFLIVWDFIRYAREQGIPVGPGRGSAAGSLVAYSLGITDIDPLEYDLLFERFLNPERVTMPDIDIDFCFRRRSEVIDYVTRAYGRENVAQIITFGTMAAKAAVRDAGRVLGLSFAEVDRIAKLVPDELGTKLSSAIKDVPKLAQLHAEDPTIRELLDVAMRLEGLARHASTHAAGVVITPEPVTRYVPLFKSSKDEITTQWAMTEVEEVGLLKMDFLGLKTLTLMTDTLDSIRNSGLEPPDLDHLPLDDPKVYELFGRGDTAGVFQFESGGMRDILRRLKPERFEDLIALNALYRPGPLGSGMIDDFIKRRHGKVEVEYPHPMTEEILAETYGVIVYQEQVMQIASKMGGYSLGGADLLRRAMGKKKVEVMATEKVNFVKGAKERAVSEKDATAIFDLMAHFAGYGFNKSHSAAYALVAYQTAYLKAHFREHFLAAVLTNDKDNTDKLVEYVNQCRERGIAILPPDVNVSGRYFTVEDAGIRFGLAAIKGVGEGAVDAIIEARERIEGFKSIDDITSEVERRAINRRVLESLVKSGALDGLGDRAALFAAIESAIERGARRAEERASGQVSLFGGESPVSIEAPPLPDVPAWTERERLAGEKEALGFYLSGHPLDAHLDKLRAVTTHKVEQLAGSTSVMTVGGLVTGLRRKRTKKGDWMAIFVLEDQSAHAECVVFPRLFREIGETLTDELAVVVSGRADGAEGDARILAESIVPLENAQARAIDGLTLTLPGARVSETFLERLNELIADHPGPVPLFFELVREGEFKVLLQAEGERSVRADSEAIGAFDDLLGPGSTRLGRPDRLGG